MNANRIALAAGMAGAAVLLSGCMSMEGDITLDSQALADGELSVALDKEAAALMGIDSIDAMEEAFAQNGGSDAAGLGDVEVSQTDSEYVATVTFEDADLNDDTWNAVVNDGQLEFTMNNEGSGDDTVPFGGEGFGDVDITVHFPGEVVQYDGAGAEQVDADTVRWQFPITESTTLTARSEIATNGPGVPMWAVGGAAAAALVGAGVWVMRRRRDDQGDAGIPVTTTDESILQS